MFLIRIIASFFALIPDRIVMRIARGVSSFFYNNVVREGRWGLRGARIIPKVFCDKDDGWHERVVKANALHLMKLAGELLKGHHIKRRGLEKKCYIREGEQHLETLLRSGKGFIIITCHLGNWEYAAAYIALMYRAVHAPVFVENSKGNELLNWIREGHNVILLATSRDPKVSAKTLRSMIELLKRGEIVYLVSDQAGLGGNFRGKLFGKELRLFGGPFILGRKTKSPILPLYSLRDESERIALYFEEPFFLLGENIHADIQKVTDFFERNIAAHPEQYLWSQDRW